MKHRSPARLLYIVIAAFCFIGHWNAESNSTVTPPGIVRVALQCLCPDFCPAIFPATPCQGPPGILFAGVANDTCGPPFSFAVTGPDGKSIPVTPISVGLVKFEGSLSGVYRVKVTNSLGRIADGTGGFISCCSFTQSDWAKNKPKLNGKKRIKTIRGRFQYGLREVPVTVGMPGRSLTLLEDAAACILDRLPASGNPISLPAGLGDARINPDTCQAVPFLPLINDKFSNELLGQTIALRLNMGTDMPPPGLFDGAAGLDLDLANLTICNTLVTHRALAPPDGLFGVGFQGDSLDPGSDGILGTQDDPIQIVRIPVSVLRALAVLDLLDFERDPTVTSLLKLANRALSGDPNLGGASLADINTAVDAVNRAFDFCQYMMQCSGTGQRQANLEISFDPNPAFARTTQDCAFSRYGFAMRIQETSGVGISFLRLDVDGFRNLPPSQVSIPSHINANNEFRADITYCRTSGASTWTLIGVDDNGNYGKWSGTIQLR